MNDLDGEIKVILEKKNGKTIINDIYHKGVLKVSHTIYLDKEKIPCYFFMHMGGGYIEGESCSNYIELKKGSRCVITTQAPTIIYQSRSKKKCKQYSMINLEEESVLEYILDNTILFKDARYEQNTEIHLHKSSSLIYADGITAGWSPEGENFKYKSVQLKSNVYINNKLVLLDNLIINPSENDVTKLGFFEEYSNFGTLLVINKEINDLVINDLRKIIGELNLPIDFGVSKLEVNGFVLRVLGNLSQHIEKAILACHNYIRRRFLGSKDLIIRKY